MAATRIPGSELLATLRQMRTARWPRSREAGRRSLIPNMPPTTDWPTEVTTRTVPVHWEGDRIKRARNRSTVGPLGKQTTYPVTLTRMGGTDARSAREGFTKNNRHVPAPLRKKLTHDQGKEMAKQLGLQIFFADPYSPWERSTMRTPMACCANTCPRAQTYRARITVNLPPLPIG